MIKVVFLLYALMISCLACATAQVPPPWAPSTDIVAPPQFGQAVIPERQPSSSNDEIAKPVENTVQLNVGPQILKLKTFYLERREPSGFDPSAVSNGYVRRHFSVLATSSIPATRLTGEGELAYSPLDAGPVEGIDADRPTMLRLALKSGWAGFNYGGEVRSFGAGFVSPAGIRTDHERDEAEIWGER
ncbi:MAG TPA: hypothetical protein VNO43_14085, partial [Candidatus Eisenbacteria bacterium]|nr:hypothetical protein [Candidatus Eisenbacteria bacterium]